MFDIFYHATQRIQIAFGGLATPPGKFKGALVKKKLHLLSCWQTSASFSKSNISPTGIPKSAIRLSCSPGDSQSNFVIMNAQFQTVLNPLYLSSFAGQASKTLASPPTQEKCLFHSHATDSSVPSTPAQLEPCTVPLLRACGFDSLYHLTKPDRIKRISPCRKVVPCQAATASRSFSDMA